MTNEDQTSRWHCTQCDWFVDVIDNNWTNWYYIVLHGIGGEYLVSADNESEAVDELIDWCEKSAPGLVDSIQDLVKEGLTEAEIDERPSGGNHGLYLSEDVVKIVLLGKARRDEDNTETQLGPLIAGAQVEVPG
jgi:hypothetical protein